MKQVQKKKERFMPPASHRFIQVHDARGDFLSEFVHGRGLDHNPTWIMASGDISLPI